MKETRRKQEEDKEEAGRIQEGNRKDTIKKQEGSRKETGSRLEANKKERSMCSDMDFKIFKNDKHTMAEAMRSLTLYEIPFREFRAFYARVPSSINNRQHGILSTPLLFPAPVEKIGVVK